MTIRFRRGQHVMFAPKKGTPKKALVVEPLSAEGRVAIRIASDPFPVLVKKSQLSACDANGNDLISDQKVRIGSKATKGRDKNMATTEKTKPSAKELRQEAQGLGIKNYEDLGRKELVTAIKAKRKADKAKGKVQKVSKDEAVQAAEKRAKSKKKGPTSAAKAASKKAPAKKATSKPVKTNVDGENPFRPGSNLALILPLLVKGGNREKLAGKLAEKVALHPYTGDPEAVSLLDYDKRIILASGTLRDKHGYTIERDGRGLSGSIKAIAPGAAPAKAKKAKKKTSKKK